MFRRIGEFIHTIGILHAVAVLILLVASTTVIIGRGGPILTLIAGSAASMGSDTLLYLTPHSTTTLNVGETTDIDVRVSTKQAINTIGATIQFPGESLEIVGISKERSFLDLWTEETTIRESEGEVHFSGGTVQKGGLVGMGTIVTLTVKAKRSGTAEMSFKEAQIYSADGTGRAVTSSNRALSFEIPESDEPVQSAIARANEETLPPLTIDFNGDGKVNVVDMSIIAFQILTPYNAKYDLDRDGVNGLTDISIFFTRMRE